MRIYGDPHKMMSHEEIDAKLDKLRKKHGSSYSEDIVHYLKIKQANYEGALAFIPEMMNAWRKIQVEQTFARKIGFTDDDLDKMRKSALGEQLAEVGWEQQVNHGLHMVNDELQFYYSKLDVAKRAVNRMTKGGKQ
tara:strand:- start:64 stop:471 length:408 start_codon:yes stop_codon:yes gene_type:complete